MFLKWTNKQNNLRHPCRAKLQALISYKLEELPKPIADILKVEPYATWTPTAAFSVKDGEKMYYQVDVKKEEQVGSLKFDAEGKPVE